MPKRSRKMGVTGAVIFCIFSWNSLVIAQGFLRTTFYPEVSYPFSTAVGDFDGDGDMDLMMSGFNGHLNWFETQTNGTRELHPLTLTVGHLRDVTAFDWNHDNKTDLLLPAYDEDRVYILTPRLVGADVVFDALTIEGFNGPHEAKPIAVAGFTEPQIAVADYLGNTFRIFRRVNSAWLQVAGFHPVFKPWDVTIIDVDGDGDLDAITGGDAGNSNNHGLVWYEQDTQDNWIRHDVGPAGRSLHVAAGNLDGDGDVDFVTSDVRNGRIDIRIKNGLNFTSIPLAANYPLAWNIDIHDFNNDGLLDIVAVGGEGQVTWWEHTPIHTFIQNNLPPITAAKGLTIADIDLDTDSDLIVPSYGELGTLFLYSNLMGIPAVIRGTVRASQSGAPVSQSFVRIPETGASALTNAFGDYYLATIPGTYTVEVSEICHLPQSIENISCIQGDTTQLDVNLARPVIHTNTSSLNIIAQNGMTTYTIIPVENSGDGPLTVVTTVAGNLIQDQWLSVSPSTLVLEPFSASELTVSVSPDTSNSQNWDYFGTIFLQTNSCPDTFISIALTAYILDAPEHERPVALKFGIHSVYPNPFNSSARISYELETAQRIRLSLFDIQGRESLILLDGIANAGVHHADISGPELSSGIYLVRLTGESQSSAQKVILLK